MVILSFAACAHSPADDAAEDSSPPDSEGRTTLDGVEPVWGASEVEAGITAALGSGLGEPVSLRNWFVGLLDHYVDQPGPDQAVCASVLVQAHDEETVVSNWYGSCEANDGTLVDGGWILTESWGTRAGGETWQMALLTTIEARDAVGNESSCGGTAQAVVTRDGEDVEFELSLGGDYDLAMDRGFLAHPVGAGFFLSGARAGGQIEATLDGGLRHDQLSLYFEEVVTAPDVCDGFSGRVRVRDPSSAWLDWDLDCSTCGPLSFQEQDLGEVCAGEALAEALRASVSIVAAVEPW